jgi:predicted negative regulator of RcsB-dependent stress response
VETGINSFSTPGQIGPMYPFVDATVVLVLVAFLVWIGWHIFHIRAEDREYKEAARLYREVGLERAMHHGGTAKIASEEEMKVAAVYKAIHEEHHKETLSPAQGQGEATHEGYDEEEARRPSS